jgi:serine/threonine-protein kinase
MSSARLPQTPEELACLFDNHPRFHHLRLLAQGGMGAVFRAVDQNFEQRTVAIKMIRPAPDAGEGTEAAQMQIEMTQRFHRETKLTGRINDPGVPLAIDHGTLPVPGSNAQVPYLVIQFIEGQDLAAILRARRTLSAREALLVLQGLAEVLAACARNGVVHRDVKPRNIMLTKPEALLDGLCRVTLIDFGVAKDLRDGGLDPPPLPLPTDELQTSGHATRVGAFLGSVDYAAPEQWANHRTPSAYLPSEALRAIAATLPDVSPQTDLYAAGAVFFHMLSGSSPLAHLSVRGEDTLVTRRRKRDACLLAPPPDLPGTVPQEVRALCHRLLAKHPKDRPASAEDLLLEIRALLKNLQADGAGPTQTQGASPHARQGAAPPPTWTRTKKAAAGLIALGGLAGLAGTFWPPPGRHGAPVPAPAPSPSPPISPSPRPAPVITQLPPLQPAPEPPPKAPPPKAPVRKPPIKKVDAPSVAAPPPVPQDVPVSARCRGPEGVDLPAHLCRPDGR